MAPAVVAALWAVGIAVLFRARAAVAGTTLVAPWAWAGLSLTAVALSEGLGALASAVLTANSLAAMRFAAAASTFCPVMALLGAKRPQDRAWQWVVVSLWIILSLPSLQSLVLHPSREFTVYWLQLVFLLILIALGPLNYLFTRFWATSLLIAGGQIWLFSGYFGGAADWLGSPNGGVYALMVVVSGMVLAAVVSRRLHPCSPGRGGELIDVASGLNSVWRDFRDDYGAVWSLRIAERVNAVAVQQGLSIRLGAGGFTRPTKADTGDDPKPLREDFSQELASIEPTFTALLLRFVSTECVRPPAETLVENDG